MTAAPREALGRFLDASYPSARCEAIAGDASSRRFFRLRRDDSEPLVVMDYGEAFDSETDDIRLERVFRRAGLPCAAIRRIAPEVGCLVLEDLGDRPLASVVAGPNGELRQGARAWLERAVDLAARVAELGTPALADSERASGPALDAERFRFEMDFFVEHYTCGLLGRTSSDPDLVAALHELADAAAGVTPTVLCHRDFHSRNLMVTADGTIAMVDIQDGRWGPIGYDLASIVRDAYLEIPESWVQPLVDRFLEANAGPAARERFLADFHLVAAQRMLKALGTFGFQVARLGRRRYLDSVPRTVARLRRSLPAHASTGEIAERLFSGGLV